MDFNLSHLKTVIQRSGEHTPNAVNMQMYGVQRYFILEEKRTQVSLLGQQWKRQENHDKGIDAGNNFLKLAYIILWAKLKATLLQFLLQYTHPSNRRVKPPNSKVWKTW